MTKHIFTIYKVVLFKILLHSFLLLTNLFSHLKLNFININHIKTIKIIL